MFSYQHVFGPRNPPGRLEQPRSDDKCKHYFLITKIFNIIFYSRNHFPDVAQMVPGKFCRIFDLTAFPGQNDNLYHPEADGGILLSDPDLTIDWQIPAEVRIISEKDTKHPLLKDLDNPF